MATVAFPPEFPISRDTSLDYNDGVTMGFLGDGEPKLTVIAPYSWANIDCKILARTKAEMRTVRTFLFDNRANDITATIDDIDFTGNYVADSCKITMSGRFFNVAFRYYAREV